MLRLSGASDGAQEGELLAINEVALGVIGEVGANGACVAEYRPIAAVPMARTIDSVNSSIILGCTSEGSV